jgi:hypothetical protein
MAIGIEIDSDRIDHRIAILGAASDFPLEYFPEKW